MPGFTDQPWRALDPALVHRVFTAIDVDAIADDVISDVLSDARMSLDEPSLTNLRLTAFAGLSEFLREVGHPEVVADRTVFREHGRAQHDSGRSVEEMLMLYRLVGLGFWSAVSKALQAADVPLALFADVGGALFSFVSDLGSAAAHGFVAAGNEAARGSQLRRDRLVEVLLEEPRPDESVVAAAARVAGWELPDRVAVAVTDTPLGAGLLEALTAAALVGRWGEHTVLLLPAEREDEVIERLRSGLGGGRAGLASAVSTAEARVAFRSAAALLALAQRRGETGGAVVVREGNELDLMVLADEDLATGLAATVLAPLNALPQNRREPLIETLAAWLARPDQPLAIAGELHVHVQTVRYRIRQLRELVGASIDDPAGRARLAVAVRAHQLLRTPHHAEALVASET